MIFFLLYFLCIFYSEHILNFVAVFLITNMFLLSLNITEINNIERDSLICNSALHRQSQLNHVVAK